LSAVEVIGTDLCFGLGVSAVGSVIQLGAGNYDGILLLKLIAGGLCGAACGSLLSGRIAQRPLRACLLTTLIVLGCRIASHEQAPKQQTASTFRHVSTIRLWRKP
jgi:hypothetical protein